MKHFIAIVMCVLFSGAIACAQPAPHDDGGGDRSGPPGRQGGDRPGRGSGMGGPGMGMPGMGGPGMGGPGMDGPGRGSDGMGPGGGPLRQFEMLRGYLDVVDRYAKVSSDPTTAGIAAVVAAAEVLKPRGPDATIEYFTKLLPDVKDASIVRAIRAQLAEQYRNAGQQDKALEQLKALMTGSPPESDKH
jgi:hypothetical protein